MAKGSLAGDTGVKKENSNDEAELDITPMIDVTFLLLIFFMVTSTMDQNKPANVPPAAHGVGADTKDAVIISIIADAGPGSERIILGDGSGGEETANMELVRRYVQAGLNEGKSLILIKADRDAKEGKVQEVFKALADFEGVPFAIGVQDQ